uniref:Uncharacterized protein n=1 Tax=viral metagenome TaxID=1070528 RepID=A0A6C0JQ95_9ZZZZ
MMPINKCPWNSDDDDDFSDHHVMNKPGIEFINLSVQKIERIINSCDCKYQIEDQLQQYLSDDAVYNIFLYFSSPGEGYQYMQPTRDYCFISGNISSYNTREEYIPFATVKREVVPAQVVNKPSINIRRNDNNIMNAGRLDHYKSPPSIPRYRQVPQIASFRPSRTASCSSTD